MHEGLRSCTNIMSILKTTQIEVKYIKYSRCFIHHQQPHSATAIHIESYQKK